MNQSSQDKTEEPTEKKVKDSVKDGQIARSKDFSNSLTLLSALVLLFSAAPLLSHFLIDYAKSTWQWNPSDFKDTFQASAYLYRGLLLIIWCGIFISLPTFLLVFLLGSFPGKVIFVLKNISPKLSRLSPVSGLKRMFGKESLVELVKSIAKASFVGLTTYLFVRYLLGHYKLGDVKDFYTAVNFWLPQLFYLGLITVLVFLVIALLDVFYQKKSHTKKLKMTKQEVKDERKNTDGNPEIKSRIRALQREVASQRLSDRVPKADVVITNPTHFSVAIHYDDTVSQAPYVIAKGVDHVASHIKLLAGAHNVQIVESPSLARAVYHTTQIDQEIPGHLYQPIAKILSYVAQCKAHESGAMGTIPRQPDIHVSGY